MPDQTDDDSDTLDGCDPLRVLPALPVHDAPDGLLPDAVLLGQGSLGDSASRVASANLSDLSRRQLDRVAPSLRSHVPHVVRASTKEQVGWIPAGRVVASVAHMQALGNRPEDQVVGESRDKPQLPLNSDLAVSGSAPLAVAGPFPTAEVRATVIEGGRPYGPQRLSSAVHGVMGVAEAHRGYGAITRRTGACHG